ncbi:MAG: BCCT family transporter [Desulfobacteraceae bacterium]|nr:BCCT family transporter [Desulfobacteraceae bacterium]
MTGSFSWFYLLSCSLFVVMAIVVALSPLGKIKLGPDDEKSEFFSQLVCHALFSRNGNRADILVLLRTNVPFHVAAKGRSRYNRSSATGI